MSKRTTTASSFEALWLTEAVRLQDLDTEVDTRAPSVPSQEEDLEQWLLRRGESIAETRGLKSQTQAWFGGSKVVFAALSFIALMSGFGAAAGFFGSDVRTVNVIWTLVGLIGIHCLALLLWLFAGRLSGGTTGRLWFWAMGLWSRARPHQPLRNEGKLARALVLLMNRNGLGQWGLSTITHSLWLLALTSSLLTMLLALSVRSYSFVLETTILGPDVFGEFVTGFGYLPSLLGFAVPDDSMIAAALSGETLGQSEAARRAWASWLCGGLTVYGILPRGLAWAYSLTRFAYSRANLHLDLAAPGFAEFEQRLSARGVVDAATVPAAKMQIASAERGSGKGGAVLALELGKELKWPRDALRRSDITHVFEQVVDSREQRQSVLRRLAEQPVSRLLVFCDSRLSPDRGTQHFLVALSQHAEQLRIGLLHPHYDENDRHLVWQESLQAIGLSAAAIMSDEAGALAWVQHHD